MRNDAVHVTDDMLAKIALARSLPEGDRMQSPTPYRNIGELFAANVHAQPDKNFLSFVDEDGSDTHWSYSEFYALACQITAFFTSFGLRHGDRIGTLMRNDPLTVMIYFGAWFGGLTVVPINCGEDDERAAFIVQNSGVKAVFTNQEQAERCLSLAAGAGSVAVIQVNGTTKQGCLDLTEALKSTPIPKTLPDVPIETECLIVYTSGTTGAPKGVVLDQSNLLADAQSIAEWHHFGSSDRALCVLPLHHVNGITVTLMTPLYSGGSIVLTRRFHAQTFWQTLANEACTWVSVVPTVLAFLTERGDDLAQFDLPKFRHIICGAGPLTVETARRFDAAFGIRVVHGYGLSETTCYSCFLPVDLSPEKYACWMFECGYPSIGCPISANLMAIQDAEGSTLPPEVRGEICIRGTNVMKYYFQRPEVNRETFAHGWFRSGDEGFYRVGEDGRDYFFITGRLKELIIRGGINYSPFDIDEVLNAIPGVRAAMAVGFENNFYGEEIGAYVQAEPGVALSKETVIAACRASMPYAKCPKVVVFGTEFPVTSTGKYQRNRLKPLFTEWCDVQFREANADKKK